MNVLIGAPAGLFMRRERTQHSGRMSSDPRNDLYLHYIEFWSTSRTCSS